LARGSLAPHPDGAERPGELLYARIVDEVRDGGLSNAEMAHVIGVAERQIRNWSGGTNAPSGRNRDRLLELHYLVGLLREVYTHEGAEIWLHGRKKSLNGRRPVDLLENDESELVLESIERLRAGAM
jgi:uncharacterized protein (DUF2384 family)